MKKAAFWIFVSVLTLMVVVSVGVIIAPKDANENIQQSRLIFANITLSFCGMSGLIYFLYRKIMDELKKRDSLH